MTNFRYKGFSIDYEIKKLKNKLYSADAEIYRVDNKTLPIKIFHTEENSEIQIQKSIVHLTEKYIDFEMSQLNHR